MPSHNPPDLLQMMTGLVETPSISSVSPIFDQSNRAVIDMLAGWLETTGFKVEILPLENQPNKANLIATLGKGPGGLVLAGHTDTVPYDDGCWQYPAFKLTEAENRLYGLGTSDMKGFLALAIEAAHKFAVKDLKQPLIILATADEESSMEGARSLAKLGRPKARYAIIGEPTQLRPIHAHKGIMMESIRVTGQSGHSSDPAHGNNALEGIHKVLDTLILWREELQSRYHDPIFKVPTPTLNLGYIHGGDNPNRICGACELHIDIRPLPGMSLNELHGMLKSRLTHCLTDSELALEIRSLAEGTESMVTDKNATIIKAAEALTGHPAETVSYCTEGPYLSAMGMETVILGPGDIAQAHQPDEYLALETIDPTLDLLKNMIHRFCAQQQL